MAMPHLRSRKGRRDVLLHAMLIVAAASTLGPFLWIALAAFKTQIDLMMGRVLFVPTLMNFKELLFDPTATYAVNFRNSLFVASTSTLLVMVIAFLAGYSLFRMNWPRWVVNVFLAWALVFNLIPPITLASAWYELFRTIQLENAFVAIVLSHTTLHLPMALFLLSSFLRAIPREMEDAAYVDGAPLLVMLRRIVLPLVMPGVISTAILVFIFSWNEFPVALALTSNLTATVPVSISKLSQFNEIKYTQMAAASMLSAIPALLALMFGQRYIVRGLTAGAVK
jgi:multiple sugar transport system permease protein